MAVNKPTKSPGQVFADFQQEQLAERAAHEHAWTLDQVQAFNNKWGEADPKTQVELNQMRPLIEASNARGDFQHPWQMSRTAAAEHMAAKGITGVLWSTAEEQAIFASDELRAEYASELKAAQEEGRVIRGPLVNGRPQAYNFDGESQIPAHVKEHEAFKKNLNGKLEAVDKRKALERDVQGVLERVDKAKKSGAFQPGEILRVVGDTIKGIEQNLGEYSSATYRYSDQPAWQSLKEAHATLEVETVKHRENLQRDYDRNMREKAQREREAASSVRPDVVVTEPANTTR